MILDSVEAKSGRYERAVERSTKRAIDELEPEVDLEIPEADDEKVILSVHKQI